MLCYCYDDTSPGFSAVASQPPTVSQEGWTVLSDYNLVTLTAENPPLLIDNVTFVQEYGTGLLLVLLSSVGLVTIIVRRRKS
jgi:hypothetical protein